MYELSVGKVWISFLLCQEVGNTIANDHTKPFESLLGTFHKEGLLG